MTRSVGDALLYAQHQHAHIQMPQSLLSQGFHDWEGACQGFVRSCYDISSLFGSAWLQWLGADAEHKHVGGDIDLAPIGSALLFKGKGKNGHIMLAAFPFPRGASGAWSNDLVRTGGIDKVHRSAPTPAWGQGYLGHLTAVNNVELPIKGLHPKPKPKQVPYAAIAVAIGQMENALETATRQHDVADQKVIGDEIARLKARFDTLRRNA